MHIEHIAIWTADLQRLRSFYISHFGLSSTELYHNAKKQFSSCFLSFPSGARIEVMTKPGLSASTMEPLSGLAHFAIAVGTEEKVRELTQKLEAAGVPVVGQPRWTGDGYFESVISDPDGNQVEITI